MNKAIKKTCIAVLIVFGIVSSYSDDRVTESGWTIRGINGYTDFSKNADNHDPFLCPILSILTNGESCSLSIIWWDGINTDYPIDIVSDSPLEISSVSSTDWRFDSMTGGMTIYQGDPKVLIEILKTSTNIEVSATNDRGEPVKLLFDVSDFKNICEPYY